MIYETLNKFIVDMEAIVRKYNKENEILNNAKPIMKKLIRESNSRRREKKGEIGTLVKGYDNMINLR